MQVDLHILKHQVDIPVIVGLQHVQKPDDMVVVCSVQLLQEHDLTEGTLRIGGVLKGIEDLLQRDDLEVLGKRGFIKALVRRMYVE